MPFACGGRPEGYQGPHCVGEEHPEDHRGDEARGNGQDERLLGLFSLSGWSLPFLHVLPWLLQAECCRIPVIKACLPRQSDMMFHIDAMPSTPSPTPLLSSLHGADCLAPTVLSCAGQQRLMSCCAAHIALTHTSMCDKSPIKCWPPIICTY